MADKTQNTGFFGNMSEVKLNELRQMILGLDTEDLRRLALFVNDPENLSKEISSLLPNSIKLLLNEGKIDLNDLIPLIESALQDSIERDPHKLSNILFPVMLPAIRKAVAEDIKNMVDSLNRTLEHGFSPKRIGWRLQALFSGMSYAEIVLSNAYIYRVRQVFLIHKKTGLLLNSVTENDEKITADDDMVSSMLSAIKDFVQDSFSVDDNNELNSIEVGKFNIWLEQGPEAIIAVVIDGDAPSRLRTILKESIEKIHLKFSLYLSRFEGDTEEFKKTDVILHNCLLSEQKQQRKKKPIILIVLFVLILGAIGYFSYTVIEKNLRYSKLEKSLESEPGIIITDDEKSEGKVVINGLRDPYAVDPYIIANRFSFDTSDLVFNLKPYISLEDNFILKRAILLLKPDQNTVLKFSDGTLYISGKASRSWYDFASSNYNRIAGIENLNTIGLEIINEESDQKEINTAVHAIEEYIFIFEYTEVIISDDQHDKFDNLINDINTLFDFDFSQDSVPVIIVIAHTSYEGNAEANEKVAYDRAEKFINLLINAEVPMEVLVPRTSFIEEEIIKYPVRSISFKITYSKP